LSTLLSHLYDKLLLVLSWASVVSQWIEQEVETALARERQQGTTILFSVRIDNTVMTLEAGVLSQSCIFEAK
jgi:hypothetical protein